MRDEYDFSYGERGKYVQAEPQATPTDDELLKALAETTGNYLDEIERLREALERIEAGQEMAVIIAHKALGTQEPK